MQLIVKKLAYAAVGLTSGGVVALAVAALTPLPAAVAAGAAAGGAVLQPWPTTPVRSALALAAVALAALALDAAVLHLLVPAYPAWAEARAGWAYPALPVTLALGLAAWDRLTTAP